MIRRAATLAVTLALVAVATRAGAHPAPGSVVELELGSRSVHAELLMPVSELSYAMAGGEALTDYLPRHVAAETPAGVPWSVAFGGVRSKTLDGHEYVSAALDLTPPPGAPVGELVLVDDAITHEVRNHYVLVLVRDDSTPADTEPDRVGVLQYPARRLAIHRTLTSAGPPSLLAWLLALLMPSALVAWGVVRRPVRRYLR